MAEDNPDIPVGTLQAKQVELEEAIRRNKEEAWILLQEDPLMIIAFTKVRRDLENLEEPDSVTEFFDEYNKKVNLIFAEENPLERYGIALTAEFLTEYWRRTKGSIQVSSINEAILKKLALLMEAVDALPESPDQKITHQIVDYSANRIIDFADYDRLKANEHLEHLNDHLDNLIDNLTTTPSVDESLMSLMYFASSSTESLEILRNQIAIKLLERLKVDFDNMTEEDKFKIAPWLGVFQRIKDENTRS